MNHVSVSPTDGNGPTQGQRKFDDVDVLLENVIKSGIMVIEILKK